MLRYFKFYRIQAYCFFDEICIHSHNIQKVIQNMQIVDNFAKQLKLSKNSNET